MHLCASMQQLVAEYQLGNCHNMKIIANKVSFIIYVRVVKVYYSCGLSTATIEYSCPSVFLCVCFCVCLCVHDRSNSKNNGSIHLNLKHVIVYENSSDEFNIGHCPIKVKVTA